MRAVDERPDGSYVTDRKRGPACARRVCQYLDGKLEMQEEAVLVFPDVDSVDAGSVAFMT